MGIFLARCMSDKWGELTIPIILIWMFTLFSLICEFLKYRRTVCSERGGSGRRNLLFVFNFCNVETKWNFWCCSQFPLPLDSRGILQKKGRCTGESNVEDYSSDCNFYKTWSWLAAFSSPYSPFPFRQGKADNNQAYLVPVSSWAAFLSFWIKSQQCSPLVCTKLSFHGSVLCLDWFQGNLSCGHFLVTVTKT